jgi:DNA-binding SARP family transcriptional activator
MISVFIKLLGSAGIVSPQDGESDAPQVGVGKPMVLIARLVVEPRGLSRQALAEFLWPDIDQHKARASVRQALHVVRRALGVEALLETRDRVSLSPALPTDWRPVQEAVERRDDAVLLQAYAGPFLENVPVLDVLDVDQWIDVERARLLRLVARATAREVQRLQQAGLRQEAALIARRLCQLHPAEPAHWGLWMRALQAGGDSVGLAEAYEAFALRVSTAAISSMSRAREVLAEHAAAAVEAGARPHYLLVSTPSAGDGPEDGDDGEASETVITLYRSPAFAGERAARQVVIGHLRASSHQRASGDLVMSLLDHCGTPMPQSRDEWVPRMQTAFESLRGVPHRIRLVVESPADGPAVVAVREAARLSRGTSLHLEAVMHPTVPALVRAWQDIITTGHLGPLVRQP